MINLRGLEAGRFGPHPQLWSAARPFSEVARRYAIRTIHMSGYISQEDSCQPRQKLREYSPNKSIHAKMRVSQSNDLVEKMLFVRYNVLAVGAIKRFEVLQEEDDLYSHETLDDAKEE